MSVIDMQTMRYINTLDIATKVKTSKCFVYNNMIVFAVPGFMMSKAIGPGAVNIRRLQEMLGKKVRIIEESNDISGAKRFIEDIVSPIKFKSLELRDNELLLNAGNTQSKAALLGRNKKRYDELKQIIHDTFNMELRVL